MQYKYIRDNLKDEYGFLALQDKILEIAVYVDSICKENNITYYLMGGSALGAKRHGGFIPWDDDLDFFMTPEAYEKFREFFKINGNRNKYYLQEWGAEDGMVTISKIRLNNTSYIEEDFKNWDIHHGIYIDIFILHNCPNCIFERWHQYLWAKYIVMKGLACRKYKRRKGFIGLCLNIISLFPDRFLLKHALKQVYKYRYKQCDNYCNFLGKALFKNGIYKKSYFLDGTYVPFEKIELKAPLHLDAFLSDRFGDYMKIPSKDRIKWEQHALSWDFDNQLFSKWHQNDLYKDEHKLI